MIGDSARKVGEGTQLADEAGKTMGDISTQVKHVSELIGQIGDASQEQSAGIGQIGQAVAQLDTVTQANAAKATGGGLVEGGVVVQLARRGGGRLTRGNAESSPRCSRFAAPCRKLSQRHHKTKHSDTALKGRRASSCASSGLL